LSDRRKDFLIFGSPLIGDAEKRETVECLESGWLGTGPRVAHFETEFRDYKRGKFAVAVNSGTAALHVSMLAANLGPGDEVITTPLTFFSTVNALIHSGARPVLADVESATSNIDPAQIEACITDRTKAIVPVHFAERPCEMDAICAIAERNDLRLIEDCAHAIETSYRGRPTGTFGDFGCFSFYVTKNITTGEGGMVLALQEENANRIKRLALHGMSKDAWQRFGDPGYVHYEIVECGYKYNMMDIQAAIGLQQLRQIEPRWQRRRDIWERYQTELHDLPLTLPAPPAPDTRHAYHLFPVLVDVDRVAISRDEFVSGMTSEQIGIGVHYRSIPTHPYYRERYGWIPEDYPHSFRIGEQTVSLPLSAKLSDDDVSDVIRACRRVCGAASA